MISIVTPVFNEEDNVIYFHDEVTKVMESLPIDYEIIYVDDGSRDRTSELLLQLSRRDSHVRALSLARNFGHQIALTCGLDYAEGDAVITMDGDLQHPPSLIPVLIQKWQDGYNIVQTIRTSTEDAGLFKKVTSAGYYALINQISSAPIVPGGSDFRLMDKEAVRVFRRFREHSRFIRGIISGMGFRQTSVTFAAPKRHAGVSKFSLRKMLHFAMDGILTNSTVPLRMAFYTGACSGLLGIILIIHVLYCKITGTAVPGWSTIMILLSLFGSLQLMGLGIIGEYIGRIFEETRQRPLYWLSSDMHSASEENPPSPHTDFQKH